VALKKLDKNSDGKLTADELMPEWMRGPFGPGGPGAFDPEGMVHRMMMADANNDGFLDEQEMPERMKAMMLDRADTDKDGKLSREELTKMVAQMGNRRGPGPGFPGPRRDRDGNDEPERPRRPRSE
jgi:Ca2+-binding EF-hand superfamily protein